jgi:hypothetical protein
MIRIDKYGLKVDITLLNIGLNLHLYKKPVIARTIGIRNHTLDGKRLVFLDYDNIMLEEQLIPELSYFQKKYKLSSFYIFKSSNRENSYHAICLDKINANTLMNLLIESGCDERYKTFALSDFKSWVLRFGRKGQVINPRLVRVINSSNNHLPKSKAHAQFLQLQYGLNTKSLKNLDDSEVLPIVSYETISNIKG